MSLSGAPILAAKHSNLAHLIISKSNSLYNPSGYSAITPTFQDDSLRITPANGVTTPTWRSKVAFNLPKVSTLIGKCWVEIVIGAGADTTTQAAGAGLGFDVDSPVVYVDPVVPPAVDPGANQPIVAYVKNVGDLIVDSHQMIYGNVQLQSHEGRFIALNRRLCCNDVNIEATNAMVLGALPPGGDPDTGTEKVLVDAFYRGVTLQVPLEELFFVQTRDRHWMPEAYALEGQLIQNLADFGQLVVTRSYSSANVSVPAISDIALRYQEVTLSAAEKEMRLSLYKSPEGHTMLFSDLEPQIDNATIRGTGVGGNLTWQIPLDNLRMDMKELIFCIHRVEGDQAVAGGQGFVNLGGVGSYAGSYMESDSSVGSILFSPAENAALLRSFSSLVPIVDMQLFANGKQIFSQPISEFVARTNVRKFYHRDSQIADPIYSVSFAQFPEDHKNATGHLSAAVLGKLVLRLTIANASVNTVYACELWSHSYNVMQSRAGGITKALN